MKTLLKIGVLAAAIMFSISSCSSCGNKNEGDEPAKIDSSKTAIDTADTTKKAGIDTVKKDSVKK
jgi:hypothetical protein